MSFRLVCGLLAIVAGAGAIPSGVDVQQTRDAVAPPTVGTASIAGVVVDDQEPAQPVRRAVVTLTGAGLRPNRGAITDDEGRFTLRGLPAGRFTLAAERAAYVTSIYGAKRPGRAGTEITVADLQQISDLRVRIWRGAVLSGVLRDESGEPLPNTPVAAVTAREVTPVALTLTNNAHATTNDQGEFRIFGLEPGTYVVRAGNVQFTSTGIAASEAEVDALLAALASRTRQPGAIAKPVAAATPIGTTVSAAPIYFPGTPAAADATPVTVKAGEERAGLDFVVRRIRTATIRGAVAGPVGAPVPSAFVQLAAVTGPISIAGLASPPVTTTSGPDGTFTLGPISPGSYRLLVRGAVAPASAPAGGVSGPFWWALAQVPVTGDDIDLGSLTLQAGLTFSGRLVFDEAATTKPPDPAGLRIELQSASLGQQPAQSRGGAVPGMRFLQPAAVRADGSFSVTDLVPEEYRLIVTGAALGASGWWLRAATWNGRDLLDGALRLTPGESITGVTLLLSDRRTELSGTITTPAGAAVTDLVVLAFPADAALRVPHSRRVRAARPDSSGRFVLEHLPPGEYLLCALADVDDGQWNEPGFLDQLVAASVKITLADGERKVQDLRVGG